MKKLPLNEPLSSAQEKILTFMVERGAKEMESKLLRDFGGITAKDVLEVKRWVKRKVAEDKPKK